jgi:PAS domain S-box-containing protein
VAHEVVHGASVAGVLGNAVPLGFGLVLVLSGGSLHLRSDDGVTPVVTALWVVAGLVTAGAVAWYFLSTHAAHGHVVEARLFLAYDVAATGAVAGLIVGRYDARARRRTRRLSEKERQFRAVFEGTLDTLVLTDDDGRYVAANPAAADLFGLPRSELLGRSIDDFAPPDRDVGTQWSSFLGGDGQRGEFELERADGEVRTVAFAATTDVLPGRHLTALRDVTERTERARERDAERERVAFLNRLLRHNVLNGMNIVLAKLDAAATELPPDRRAGVETARHRCEEIVDLVQTARRLATGVTGETGTRRLPLSTTLRPAVSSVRDRYDDATVTVRSSEDDPRVLADEMLQSVFEQLLTNAFEHNDPESVSVTVDVTTTDESVTVSVADDGVGIPPEKRAALFGDGFAHHRDWGGFGLSIVEVLVEGYDGEVRVTANEPSGVVFHVELLRAED